MLGMGDMLYHPAGARAATRVQGAFVSDPEIESVLEFIKENVGETHYSEDLERENRTSRTGENGVTPVLKMTVTHFFLRLLNLL